MNEIKDYFLYLLFKFFKFLFLNLPKNFVKKILDFLAYLTYKFDKKHYKIAKRNLDLVYQDSISNKKKEEIILNSYKNLFYNIYETLDNLNLDLESFNKKIKKIENEEIILNALKENKNIILITAHYGNWELLAQYIGLKYAPITVVGRKLNNKYLNKELLKYRNSHNSQMLTKDNSAKGLIKAIKQKRIVGLVVDQHIDPKKGQIISFLGLKAPQVDSSARLAIKLNCIIIPFIVKRIDFDKYDLAFYEPIIPSRFNNDLKAITQKEADIFSKQILSNPNIWFWQHKRFKEFYDYE